MNRFDQDLQRAAKRLATEPLPEGVLDDALDGLEANRPQWLGVAGVVGAAAVLVLVLSIGLGQMMTALGPEATPPAVPDGTASPIPSPTPSETPSLEPIPAGPVVASVEEDGIRVTLEVDRGQVSFGDRVWALVTIENLGSDIIIWGHSSTCVHAAGVAALPGIAEPLAYGRTDWQGNADILKRTAVFVPNPESGFIFMPEAWVDRANSFACTTDRVRDEVPVGGTLTFRGAWDVVGPHCMAAPPGRYWVRASFAYDGRGDREPLGIENELLTISVEVPFYVRGPEVPYLSPWQAVDAALGDADFHALFDSLRLQRWVGADLEFLDAEWILRVNVEGPDQALVAEIDAVSGRVSNVRLIARAAPYEPLAPCRT